MGKRFEELILGTIQIHIDESNLPTTSSLAFEHTTEICTFQYTGLIDHDTLNFNNNTSVAAVFLDITKAFDTSWHTGLLHKLSELKLSTTLITNISSFLTKRKFKVSVEGEVGCLGCSGQ